MRWIICRALFAGLCLAVSAPLAGAETVAELHQAARAALAKGQSKEALALAGKAIELDPRSAQVYLFRGSVHEELQQHAEAIADFDRAIELNPSAAEAYNRRGSEQFKLGRIKESIADFDKFLELKPEETAGHWKRGISYYYAGRFDEGRKQFLIGEKVFPDDVENAVWHYLCVARKDGVEKARASLLKIGHDKRIPMMEVYALFAGKGQPADVLTAARAGSPPPGRLRTQLFYAHLYLGLYFEAAGDPKQALDHMTEAVQQKVAHYMWDVANVHLEMLKRDAKK